MDQNKAPWFKYKIGDFIRLAGQPPRFHELELVPTTSFTPSLSRKSPTKP